jgi:hypothetical protein
VTLLLLLLLIIIIIFVFPIWSFYDESINPWYPHDIFASRRLEELGIWTPELEKIGIEPAENIAIYGNIIEP